jgi:hypothetical protein
LRRIDRAAQLSERSTTALELGAKGADFPLALAQMRDAVEHLKRVDMLEAFPLRVPKNELLTAFFLVVIAAIVGFSPNPWLLRARASNPAITIAREQAQRVQRWLTAFSRRVPEIEAYASSSKGARPSTPRATSRLRSERAPGSRRPGAPDEWAISCRRRSPPSPAPFADPATQNPANYQHAT